MNYRVIGALFILGALALVPFGLIARSRATHSPNPAPHLFLDMDDQAKYLAQSTNPMWADGRAMRPVVPGTVAREDLIVDPMPLNDPAYPRMVGGKADGFVIKDQATFQRVVLGEVPGSAEAGKVEYVSAIPDEIPVSDDLLKRGQERFNIYCAPCHGISGYGNGMVHVRAARLQEAGGDAANWVPPTNFHTDDARKWTPGHIYAVATNGVRSMPPYAKQTTIVDRWAIAAYVKALQRSQHATDIADVPDIQRNQVK